MSRRLEHHTRAGLTLSQSENTGDAGQWVPNTDIYQLQGHPSVHISMELAGVAPESIEISLKDRILTVRGKRPDDSRQEKSEFQQMEIDYGAFERQLRLPRLLAGDRATARFTNGFLQIEIPRTEEQQEKEPSETSEIRVIPIRS